MAETKTERAEGTATAPAPPAKALGSAPLGHLLDVTVPVTVELGRTRLSLENILRLAPGAVVELEHPADAPVDLFIHGKRIASGEIVVVDDYYGIRITSLGAPEATK
jgi:flagellar motor switch protein FliN/FliY